MASGGIVASKPAAPGATYTYSSQPRVVQQRKKFREDQETDKGDGFGYGNIMYDRRIVRGNTYALHTLPASAQPDPLEVQRQQEARRRAIARKKAREQMRVRTPDAVDGRRHTEVQTELYLEEITDRVTESDVTTQTDAFLDRPPTPLFIPAKSGKDISTQIKEGDLFDFDVEVRPILEVLVGKTVEQSLLEVMEEEELASLRRQQREFEERRNAELVEVQRLEEQERRRTEEKERRMRQQREALMREKETSEKVAARAFAQGYLSDLVPSVFNNLSRHGFFYDTVEREIETTFIPWLMDKVKESVSKQAVARAILDGMLKEILKKKLGIEESGSVQPQDGVPSPTVEPLEKKEDEGPKAVSSQGQEETATAQSTQDPKEEERVFGQPVGEQKTEEEATKVEDKGEKDAPSLEEEPSKQEPEDTSKPTEEEKPLEDSLSEAPPGSPPRQDGPDQKSSDQDQKSDDPDQKPDDPDQKPSEGNEEVGRTDPGETVEEPADGDVQA
jgi:hypothetical protein